MLLQMESLLVVLLLVAWPLGVTDIIAHPSSRIARPPKGMSSYGAHQLLPRSGPISGGTILTFDVANYFEDWRPGDNTTIEVTVGDQTCHVVKRVASLLKCKTPPVSEPLKTDLVITLKDSSNKKIVGQKRISAGFEYKIPILYRVDPDYGPVAGGTEVSILGMNLDIGFQQEVTIGDKDCKLLRINKTVAACLTDAVPAGEHERPVNVALAIDGHSISPVSEDGRQFTFTFMPNPVINSISPKTAKFSEEPLIVVSGLNLKSVRNPKMMTTFSPEYMPKEESHTTDCPFVRAQQMVCLGVSAAQISGMSPAELENHPHPMTVKITFQMDGVHLPLNSKGTEDYFGFIYLPAEHSQSDHSGTAVPPCEPAAAVTKDVLLWFAAIAHFIVLLTIIFVLRYCFAYRRELLQRIMCCGLINCTGDSTMGENAGQEPCVLYAAPTADPTQSEDKENAPLNS